MALTKQYAKTLAAMLPPEQFVAFRFICGKNEAQSHVTPEVIADLIALELIRRDNDGERDLVLLTAKGKKVAEFV